MTKISIILAKLAGIRTAVISLINENVSRGRSKGEVLTRSYFEPEIIKHYFEGTSTNVEALKAELLGYFEDFQQIDVAPDTPMASTGEDDPGRRHYSRRQAERLVRDIDQIFEIRANSELAAPAQPALRRVFVTHGHSSDWREVQAFIEKDAGLATIELAQEPNRGLTLIEKLLENASRCDSAVIVMTGDDVINVDEVRARENVIHELGFFQGKYGRGKVIMLHEEGVNIPTNLAGVAYIPYPKRTIASALYVLQRELKAIYPP